MILVLAYIRRETCSEVLASSNLDTEGEAGGGSLIQNERCAVMQLKGGCRAHGRRRPFDGCGDRRSFGFALRDQHNAARREHRRDSLRYAQLWNSFQVMVEKASVGLARLLCKGCDSSARGKGGGGFVEADVAVISDTQNLQIDPASFEDPSLVGPTLRIQIFGVAIGHMNSEWIEAEGFSEIAINNRPVALRMPPLKAHILVKGES